MPLNEFDIINQYFNRAIAPESAVIKGIGDDGAIVSPTVGKQLVMSVDTMVAGCHFPENTSPFNIGSRALCTSLSDLAAMGAKPLWFTLGLTLPESYNEWLEQFSAGLFSIADRYHCELIGGDITRGPLTITIQVHGEVFPDTILRRDGAVAGDQVFVTGPLGDGAAALAALQNEISISLEDHHYLSKRFYSPEPQIIAGQTIAALAHSAIDISDGLLADAAHIAKASGVAIVLHIDRIPTAKALKNVDRERRLRWLLTGGDDYQLLFTVAAKRVGELADLISQKHIHAYCIGEVRADNSGQYHVRCFDQGQRYHIGKCHESGYQHFTT
ncbi:thiamine-phosphate kinase [Candidatus Endobugula sertula]|uniref:Thiamine-monophosphate kinase n=1 Tax=Candidatus Endobugula sertula TaxID=62101 RepID=A0A1D2QRS3_9GAMM|nr:thiamine-phosphate kinase [Candidatus Endobugula sertula]